MGDNNSETLKNEKHHKQEKLCETRPPYRQGRKLTAVKVYTVSSESQHMFIYGVPKIKLRAELKSLCTKYGQLKNIHAVEDYQTEVFTECYHVQYERIQSARIAKRMIDNRSFYGSVLHVCYAPEFETVDETRAKLNQRRLDVTRRMLGENDHSQAGASEEKRKFSEYEEPEEFQDPILFTRREKKRFRQQMIVSKPEQICDVSAKAVTYGPSFSDFRTNIEQVFTEVDAPRNLIPTQVVRNINKAIVFKKKFINK